ncbi:tRNA pseudouridine(65) synthase TruC [Cellvibrio sp. NN19]|uniref:tRNA pseudouridine(65) synthase TruC n=1 Tax=Cellvibrio chitinivorans TaxID=3102792 RepID=UPI002B40C5C7|nr:tRNA pseudouridine(65) synthase TruC [Cellvibrio sp. NN19]
MTETLPIIYRDEHIVAINKPGGLLVHRSEIDRHETRFAVQLLRDQIGQLVYPAHRLDKPTSGVLVFALSPEIARQLGDIFARHALIKTYVALVRGFTPDEGTIDHPLIEELDKYTDQKARMNKPAQEAITEYKKLAQIEFPFSIDKYPCTRYSLVQCNPKTGRKHQIRRHLKHISHPIIGDAKHGKGNHNRFFQEKFSCSGLMLASPQMEFVHPVTNEALTLIAPLAPSFTKIIQHFGWTDALPANWINSQEQ